MKEVDLSNKEDVLSFISACDEFIDGKFILADIKISKILRAVSQSNLIYDLIAESLINYDFQKELEKVTANLSEKDKDNLELPENKEFIIPFVFSLLVEIDSKRIDFNEFLMLFFPLANSQKEEYDCFAKTVILPFKEAISQSFQVKLEDKEEDVSNLYGENNESEDEEIDESEKIDENVQAEMQESAYAEQEKSLQNLKEEYELLFSSLIRSANLLKEKSERIKNSLKRSNIILLADALIEASEIKNLTIVSALVMSLGNLTHWEKAVRNEVNDINSICYELFSK